MHLTSPCAGVALVHPPLPQPPTKSTGHDDRHLSFRAGQFHGPNPDPHARCCRDARPGSIERQRQCTRLARAARRCRNRHRSEEHTSELQSLMRISYAVFCLKKKMLKLTKTMNTSVLHLFIIS